MELESNLKNGYMEAYRVACARLAELDGELVSLNTNSIYDRSTNTLTLRYLNKDYRVSCENGEVTCDGSAEEITTTIKVLLLHYLINANIKPLSGNLISFKEIKGGGAIYYQTFQKRAILPLVKCFGQNTGLMLNSGSILGGVIEKYGNASVTLKVFPLVPITYVVWQGDEEVPASATILFDDSVTSYLPGEDIVLAASFGSYELIKYSSGGNKI